MKISVLMGDGSSNAPYWVHGFRNEESTSVKTLLKLCDREGIEKLKVAHSGRYYERRSDGWWLTSDTEQCDRAHGLPPEGQKIL